MKASVPVSLAVLSSLLAGATPAAAQSEVGAIDFGIRCSSGAFRACASVSAWTEVVPRTYSGIGTFDEFVLFVEVANMQGLPHFEDLQASGLYLWELDRLALRDCTPAFGYGCDVESSTEGDLYDRWGDFSSGPWGTSNGAPSADGDRFRLFHTSDQDDSAILGCDDWGSPVLTPIFFSCGTSHVFEVNLGFGAGFALTNQTSLTLGFTGIVPFNNTTQQTEVVIFEILPRQTHFGSTFGVTNHQIFFGYGR